MALTYEEVEHIAQLARLTLDEDERDLYRNQLSDILAYAARLQEIDTQNIPPTATVLPLRTVLREDKRAESIATEDALHNAPQRSDDCFVVPPLR